MPTVTVEASGTSPTASRYGPWCPLGFLKTLSRSSRCLISVQSTLAANCCLQQPPNHSHHPPDFAATAMLPPCCSCYRTAAQVYYLYRRPIHAQSTMPTWVGAFRLLRLICLRERITLVHCHQAFSTLGGEALLQARTMGYKVR